ncbi:hypothetical protein NQ318_014848 [Aromia moschata]|uniref:Uncharacterized protein n=1 Tax=Aromia moschata TaxID=1265417 RepID=A0AAV8X5H0_9CUCU|nr:hypothetical protein NQ318_014848 [Aromia moschata]
MTVFTIMDTNRSNIGHLEDEALKRRDKLKALKRKREGKNNENGEIHNKDLEGEILPKPIFRSYKPSDESFNELTLNPAAPGDVTSEVKGQLESAKSEIVIDQLDVTSLAPRETRLGLEARCGKKISKAGASNPKKPLQN